MNAHLELSFSTTQGRNRTIRIPDPILDVDDATVRSAMSNIIGSNMISSRTGSLSAARSAVLVQQTITPIALV